jgi:ABC-type multidrug transport system ATPase subunit
MPQEIALFKEFTIEEMLQFFGSVYNMQKNEINQRIEHFIEIFKLPEKERKISELSGGQQRLVSVAVTMIHRPSLLILDEPTVGVDSLLRCQMWEYLNKLCKDEGQYELTIIRLRAFLKSLPFDFLYFCCFFKEILILLFNYINEVLKPKRFNGLKFEQNSMTMIFVTKVLN